MKLREMLGAEAAILFHVLARLDSSATEDAMAIRQEEAA
jgi:hypothetical protein